MTSQIDFNFLNESVEVISAGFDVFDQSVVVYGTVAVNQAVSKIKKRFQSNWIRLHANTSCISPSHSRNRVP